MALENAVRVENGKVMGAYASQAKNVSYGDGTVEGALDERITTDDGTFTDESSNTYTGQTVDMISYDSTNNQLLMKVNGADTVIPFSRGGGGGATLIGTYSGNQTIDVSEYLQSGDTVDNFIVEVTGWTSGSTSQPPISSKATYYGVLAATTIGKSLNGTTLSTSGMSASGGMYTSGWGTFYATRAINYKVYHV